MNKASGNGRSEKEKPQKLCLANNKARPVEDRNANNAECGNSPTFVAKPIGGTISKTVKKNPSSSNSKKCHRSSTNVKTKTLIRDENYMEFEFFNKENCTEPTRIFGNLTVPYRTINEAGNIACNNTPPPIPPPISELPSRSLINQRNNETSVFSLSCPSTPSRGKVVLSKKERKELTKLEKLKYRNTGSVRSLITPDSGGCHSAQTSPYKGRVMELKNCIARINSKVLFASMNRTSQKSLNSQNITEQEKNSTNEVSSPPPTPYRSSLSSNACNNNELDYTEKLKNLPVRPRKAHFSHMDNYCLFDPMDFVNEKTSRKAKNEKTLTMHLACQMQTHNLNDQLFSSHQYLCIKEGAENIIHEADTQNLKEQVQNFEHHNYFVINPDDMEDDPSLDICIPNQFTNEEIMKMRLLAAQHDYVNNIENLKYSASLQNFADVLDVSDQTSNNQDDKGNSTKTPVALLESSTSINSSSSTSNSNVSTHMSMQNCNKKITFLHPSAYHVQKSDSLSPISHDGNISVGASKNQERAISELLSNDHMSHLQEMLLSASSARANRSRTIPIESNYALFNPCSVKTRNVQYKIRKPRPLSTHSDADSGFLSPCSAADEFSKIKFNPAILVLQQCDSVQGYIEIYTDWANYYLERTKSEKKVTDLSSDCRDGLLLSEIIEAVTSFKVLDLYKKPKNQQQMYDNVNSCLNILRSHSVAGIDSIDANDICCGRLKGVLALFLALSRYKQQSKQLKYVENTTATVANNKNDSQQQSQPIITTRIINNSGAAVKVNSSKSRYANVVARSIQQQQQSLQNDIDATLVSRDIPKGYSEANGSAIHLQGTVIVQGRCPPDKVRPLPPTPNHIPCKAGLGKSGNELSNSRPNSPPHLKFGNNNGLRPPYVKTCKTSCLTTPAINIIISNNVMPQKNSLLDKFKLFHRHNQQEELQSVSTLINKHRTTAKRTSSSSGFSTHRSERSDSTLSLNEGLVSQVKSLPNNATSANKGRDSKTNTKQPKQSIGQSKKGLMKNSSKAKKTEKSPARCSHREESGLDTESFALNRVKQSSSRNDKESPNNKSTLNSKSETKTLLNMPTVNKSLISSTVLPKPIAAIKGTSKLLQDDTQPENKTRAPNPNLGEFDISNSPNGISYPQKTTNSQPPTYIVKPVLIISEKDAKTNVHSDAHMTTLNNNNIEGSSLMKSTQEALYNRFVPPKIAFDTPSNIRKLKCNIRSIVLSSRIKTHSQPVTPTASNNIKYENFITTKFHTLPSKSVTTIYEEDKPINVLPMRPLLKGYNSHVTLPTRTNNGSQHFLAHFTDNSLQEGYCSDGGKSIHLNKGLRTLPLGNQEGFNDFDNGYLSEGSNGAGLTQCTSPINRRGKHFLSVMRVHTQLPTTIEEGISNSRFSSDSLGTTVASSAASQASSNGSSIPKMNTGKSCNNDNSSNNSAHSSPQYQHNTSYRSASRQINNRDNWSKMPEQLNGHKIEHKEQKFSLSRRSSNGGIASTSNKQGSQSSRTKGVPPRFGYTKRSNGASTSTAEQQNITLMLNSINNLQNGRTGHVSTVHQTHTDGNGRRKVTGGTQTLPNDVTRVPPHTQYRSYSLTGPGATQLSQSIRERLSTGSHSLPKPGNDIYQERSIKSEKMYPSLLTRGTDLEIEPYYCLPVESAQNNALSAQMAVGVASNSHNFINDATVSWSQPTSPTPFNRVFANTMTPTHANTAVGISNITSLVAGSSSCTHKLTYPKKNDDVHGSAASLLSGGSSLYGTSEERQAHEIRRLKRELIEAREQVLSLSSQLSTNAHVVAAFEQSLFNMTTRLQQLTVTAERKDSELTDLRQTIELLRKQSIQAGLTTAHMQSMGVQTQSQSQNYLLSNKPAPLSATLALAAQPLSHQSPKITTANGHSSALQRHHSSGSMCSVNSIRSVCSAHDKTKKKKGWLRSSFTKAFSRNTKMSKTNRHVEQHPHNNTNALDSNMLQPNESIHGTPVNHQPPAETPRIAALATQPTALCSSITASDKTVTIIDDAKPIDAIDQEDKNHEIVEDLKKQLREKDLVLTDIRLEALSSASQLESLKETLNKMRAEMMSLKQNNERLQKIVTSRSLACSEASLGNATSPNSSIAETRRYSLADSSTRPPIELPKRLDEEVEEENILPAPGPEPPPPPLSPSTHIDLTPPTALEPIPSPVHINTDSKNLPDVNDGKKIAISVYLGQPESFHKYCEELLEADEYYTNSPIINSIMAENVERKTFSTPGPNEFVIAYTYISGKTIWQNLDYIVRKTFKDYVSRIDPGTNLGLNTDSITSYHLGEAKRGPEMGFPELLPCGYIIGSVRTLYVCLQGVGSLAFDSLIHRSIVHRYISLLAEHRRLILCGPSGTGKSYLARRLAEFLVARIGIRGHSPSEAIATFNVDHKSSKELRQYLGHIAEQTAIANGTSELPSVIILDNLHHASALTDVFSCLLSAGPAAKLPCIIGTISQATCNTTNLQLHHNFRWVLTANHMEPVKGFLGRFLRRRLFQLELQSEHPQPDLTTVLAWLPTVWQHINRFLEAHSSSDVTIGPRLFLSCPLDLKESQLWFTDIWNYHLSPYLIEAVREGVQLYGRRGGTWNDPSVFIRNSYPWPYGPDSLPPLRQINAEDVGLEGISSSNEENQDPLLNMLMRLQEAANYSENLDPESDCVSLDSNVTPDSSADAE